MNPEKLIINLAPTGMVPTRAQSPHVPLSCDEIVADACAAIDAGAAMVHLHARDAEGAPSSDPELFRPIMEGIRARRPQAVLTVTTSGRNVADVEVRANVLRLQGQAQPDMASLTLGSMNFATQASVNAPATILRLAEVMREHGIKPELEVFDLGMVNFAKFMIGKGLLDPPYYFNILLGNLATAQLDLLHLATIVRELPDNSIWALAGLGRHQWGANALGCVVAHGVRTGLEDNLWLDDARSQLATNVALVQRVAQLARATGREIASPAEVRQRLGLRQIEA